MLFWGTIEMRNPSAFLIPWGNNVMLYYPRYSVTIFKII